MIRSVVSFSSSPVSGAPARSRARCREVDRLADEVVGRRPQAQVELLAVVVVSPLRPHCATGSTTASVVSASRATPVRASIGHQSGSRVTEPSG